MTRRLLGGTLTVLALAVVWPGAAGALDLSRAALLVGSPQSSPEKKAVGLLLDEVERRTGFRWAIAESWPTQATAVIRITTVAQMAALSMAQNAPISATDQPGGAEGFSIQVRPGPPVGTVTIVGNDPRGVLFGVGHLLRHLHLEPGRAEIADDFAVRTAPRYRLRGHQLGYRPKTHSYDAWDLATWEQYYRDLIVFGANAVELVPPRTDDDASSPHFPLPPMRMMTEMSRLADEYGLDVWIWYPAMDRDYGDAKTVEFALSEWGETFRRLPRIDAVFVPGGDPGHTRPRTLLALLEQQTANLHRSHPRAQMWVSPQSFDQAWLDEFIGILQRDRPRWLTGVVFGPQVRVSLPELRAAIPAQYPIRHYPDITHTRQCQYPVPDWDTAFAITEGRECINPRPEDQAAIFRLLQPHTVGFLTYSEGCNDDVNKMIWSALGWDPDRPVVDILREYGRYFIGAKEGDDFASGLWALERNWRGPILANRQIPATLQQFQRLEREASPRVRANWRFQQALFRAYYDAYTRERAFHETALEDAALRELSDDRGDRGEVLAVIERAEAILNRVETERVAPQWRARIFELAEALFQSIRMQLSVPRYQAIAVDRGASLDTVDYPLNNRNWWRERFAEIRQLRTEPERRRALDAAVGWTDPGPGGFYDDLGQLTQQPHLVRGLPFADDPASLRSSKTGFEEGDVVDEPDEKPTAALRYSWLDHAESLVDQPLTLRYQNLDRTARYRVRVVYAGDSPKKKIRLTANGAVEIHPFITKPFPYRPVEFDLPPRTTQTGELTLQWNREPGLAGNGRGCQVSEVWLIKRASEGDSGKP